MTLPLRSLPLTTMPKPLYNDSGASVTRHVSTPPWISVPRKRRWGRIHKSKQNEESNSNHTEVGSAFSRTWRSVMKMDPVAGGLRSEKSPCLQSKTMDSSALPAVCAPSRLASASASAARHQQHFQSCMPATASCCCLRFYWSKRRCGRLADRSLCGLPCSSYASTVTRLSQTVAGEPLMILFIIKQCYFFYCFICSMFNPICNCIT